MVSVFRPLYGYGIESVTTRVEGLCRVFHPIYSFACPILATCVEEQETAIILRNRSADNWNETFCGFPSPFSMLSHGGLLISLPVPPVASCV